MGADARRARTRSSSTIAPPKRDYPAGARRRAASPTAEIGTHAGLADTSLALAIDPQLVRADELASGEALDAAHGVYGDPRRASAALGQLGVDAIVAPIGRRDPARRRRRR